MGRQHNTTTDSSTTMHSSIALLQERFRQLQRVKEMREERELLRLFSESSEQQVRCYNEPSKLFFHPELIIPSTPTTPPPTTQGSHASLPYRPELQTKYTHYHQAVDSPLLMSLWPADRSNACKSATIDPTAAEVDTSLHL